MTPQLYAALVIMLCEALRLHAFWTTPADNPEKGPVDGAFLRETTQTAQTIVLNALAGTTA
jgi:hypothetical protein